MVRNSLPVQFVWFVATILACIGAPSVAQPSLLQGLGDLPGYDFHSQAHGVSGDGLVVVGQSLTLDENEIGVWHAFRWTESEGMQDLGVIAPSDFDGSSESVAYAVSADGSFVVGYTSSESQRIQAFRWSADLGMQGLGSLPGSTPHSIAYAVSADGSKVAGQSTSTLSGTLGEAFLWTESEGLQALGVLPGGTNYSIAHGISSDGNVVVGYSNSGNREAFLWHGGTMEGLGDLPNSAIDSWAFATNSDGSVVVGRGYTEFGYEPFRWTESTGMQALRDPEAMPTGTEALAVSGDGAIVVGHTGNPPQAFIWTESTGLRHLRDVLQSDYGLDVGGWDLQRATGISDDGAVIVGSGFGPQGLEAWRAVLGAHVSVEKPLLSAGTTIGKPYPNPFSQQMVLEVELSEVQHVTAVVYDILGRQVAELHDGSLEPGTHTLYFDASGLSSGTYVIRLLFDAIAVSQSVVLSPLGRVLR